MTTPFEDIKPLIVPDSSDIVTGAQATPSLLHWMNEINNRLKAISAYEEPEIPEPPDTTGRSVAGTPLVQNPVDLGETVSQAHGLGVSPTYFKIEMECLTGEGGYVAGDVIRGGIIQNYLVWTADATTTTLVVNSASVFVWRKDTQASLEITPSRWKITLTPYALTTS